MKLVINNAHRLIGEHINPEWKVTGLATRRDEYIFVCYNGCKGIEIPIQRNSITKTFGSYRVGSDVYVTTEQCTFEDILSIFNKIIKKTK